ncbi:MAG: carboxylesterase family protein, partial [Clostridia bacterium]|nr:carboxylesterase family protein [Clostridia bacterium]
MKKKFIVFSLLALLLFAALFELGKNTLWGWALLLVLFISAFILHKKVFSEKKFPLRLLAFVAFLALICVVFKLSGPPQKQVAAVDVKSPEATEVVTVAQGDLTGVYNEDKSVEVYAGIPFAAPPVGDLRWKEPQPPANWDGVRVCDTFAPRSMQADSSVIMSTLTQMVGYHNFKISLKDNYVEAMSEDSLYLNIWKPAGELKDCPVLFFIHGGSLTTGNTSYSEYNGESLAKRGIIVVNCAYRLNVFGYYANELLQEESPNGTTGNYGLLDQIAALKWVNDNIASFGGDPTKITIAGESAGSSSVNAICVSPLAKGLFRYAIAESSGITAVKPYHTFRSLQSALKSGSALQEEFGANDLTALRAIPAEKLVLTKQNNSSMTVDGYAIKEQPYKTYLKGKSNEQALMNGFNVHEADYFTFLQKVTSENYEESLKNVLGDYAKEAVELYPPEPVDPAYKLAIVEQGGDAKGAFNKVYSAAWFSYS